MVQQFTLAEIPGSGDENDTFDYEQDEWERSSITLLSPNIAQLEPEMDNADGDHGPMSLLFEAAVSASSFVVHVFSGSTYCIYVYI